MKQLMLDALDEAARQKVITLFNVLVTQIDDDAALQRFSTGIENCMAAHIQATVAIKEKCESDQWANS